MLKAKGVHVRHVAPALFAMGLSHVALHPLLFVKRHTTIFALPYLLFPVAGFSAKETQLEPFWSAGLIKVALVRILLKTVNSSHNFTSDLFYSGNY